MNIWVSRLYDASKAKRLRSHPTISYKFSMKKIYLISRLASVQMLSESFKNSSGPNWVCMQTKPSDLLPAKWQLCWHSGLRFTFCHGALQLSHDTVIRTNWVQQDSFGGRNYTRASASSSFQHKCWHLLLFLWQLFFFKYKFMRTDLPKSYT